MGSGDTHVSDEGESFVWTVLLADVVEASEHGYSSIRHGIYLLVFVHQHYQTQPE